MYTILSVNNYYYPRGGAEVVFLEHNKLFEDAGWQVVPFSMKHPKNLENRWADYFIEDIEFDAEYSMWDKVRRIPKTIYSLEAKKKLSELLTKTNPDICHLHNIYHHISPSILSILKERDIPTVLTLHDLKLACPAYKMLTHDGICERCKNGKTYNVILHRCLKRSYTVSALVAVESIVHSMLGSYNKCIDRFVVPSQFYIRKFIEWGWDNARFTYVPNFVNISEFKPDYHPGKSFVYIGRLSSEKGVATLIKAVAMAKVSLHIVGAGPEEASLRQLATHVGGEITFQGYLSGKSLHDVIRSARAVVLPSEWYENAPMSVMEAYALGKPVIGAAIGGIPELIQEGLSGTSFQSGSAESLASVLASFSEDSETRLSDMGRFGRSWMEKEFTEKQYMERMLGIYRELGVMGI